MRDRIKELRRVPARMLRPNPKNWRTHPRRQQEAVRGILDEVGYADALLARELQDGALELIDGHLRAETTPDMQVPVLVLDVTAEEADKLLAVLDPLAGMAETDPALLAELAESVRTDSEALQTLLDNQIGGSARDLARRDLSPKLDLVPAWQLVVECTGEAQQQELYERLVSEGFKVRVLTL